MQLAQFLAWFEGFSENIEGAPTEKQWDRLKQKLAQLEPETSFQPVSTPKRAPAQVPHVAPPAAPVTAEAPIKTVTKKAKAESFRNAVIGLLMSYPELNITDEVIASIAEDIDASFGEDPEAVAKRLKIKLMAF